MTAWLLIVSVYSQISFQTFDGGNWYQNWQNCTAAAETISNFYADNQPWVSALVQCTQK